MSARRSQHGRVREDPRPDPGVAASKVARLRFHPTRGKIRERPRPPGLGPHASSPQSIPLSGSCSLPTGRCRGARQPRLSPRGQGLSGAPSLTPDSGISAGAEASHAADPRPQICSQASSFSRWVFARPSPIPSLGFKGRPPPLLTLNTPTRSCSSHPPGSLPRTPGWRRGAFEGSRDPREGVGVVGQELPTPRGRPGP